MAQAQKSIPVGTTVTLTQTVKRIAGFFKVGETFVVMGKSGIYYDLQREAIFLSRVPIFKLAA